MDEFSLAISNRISIDVERSLIHQDIISPPTSSSSTNFSFNSNNSSRTMEILNKRRSNRVLPPQKPIPMIPLPPIPSHPYSNNFSNNSFTNYTPPESPYHIRAPSLIDSSKSTLLFPSFDEYQQQQHAIDNRQSISRFSKRKSKLFTTKLKNLFN